MAWKRPQLLPIPISVKTLPPRIRNVSIKNVRGTFGWNKRGFFLWNNRIPFVQRVKENDLDCMYSFEIFRFHFWFTLLLKPFLIAYWIYTSNLERGFANNLADQMSSVAIHRYTYAIQVPSRMKEDQVIYYLLKYQLNTTTGIWLSRIFGSLS